MNTYHAYPLDVMRSLSDHWRLVLSLAKRDLSARYRGSLFGFIWAFMTPVLMLIVYTFVFSVIFKARWGTGSDSKTEFALVLFIGLILFNFFAECLNQSPNLIINNANYVKKVVFPLEVLPWVNLTVSAVNAGISFSVWLVAYVVFFGLPSLTVLLAPIVILPFLLFVMGLSWFVSAVGVFVRDVAQFVTILVAVTMFMSPIFYPLSALPEEYRIFVSLNPLTLVVEQMRQVLFFGQAINWFLYAVELAGALLIAWLGFIWFQKTRKGFADVI
ncbi:ABC transporter permease [Rhizobium sp. CFBP 8762]|uniref:ABC transporter permease n=1 Tax=Rhizobium sp. CFBP 8762 TaxID=2775279 RepID=UPI00177F342E|nr:ABC transporter permease [Rhizobium sp. CFBP 8762]MBD8555130.1 ABC transporter permease [Rhizobium sp. CFBP 8762]